MPRRKSSISEFEELRSAGIAAASKLVIEHQYDMAKDVFMKLLTLSPNDLEVMTLHANIFFLEGKLLEAERSFPDKYPIDLL